MTDTTLRTQILGLLGLDTQDFGLSAPRVVGVEDFHGWQIERLVFEAQDGSGEEVPGVFLRPPKEAERVPAVIYAHAHGNTYQIGSAELFQGRPSLRGPYAPDLVAAGIAALCIDLPAFGARQVPSEDARAKALLWQGGTLYGQMLAELRAGVDFLCDHPSVRADRIGALGFSMGSTLAWWLAALDPRIRAASAQCSFADLADLVASGGHDGHGIYMTVPRLLPLARSGQIAGLTAPRELQICVGLEDWSTPPGAFAIGRRDLEDAYRSKGALSHLHFHVEPASGHVETPQMRAAVLEFLGHALCR